MCLAFIAALPVSLNGLPERHVSAGSEQNAAYGDPAVTAACGVPTSNSVTSGPVAVTVPEEYAQPGQWTILFSDPLIQAMPSISDVPAGCHGA